MSWTFHGPDHTNAVSFVRSFCSDYTTWNDGALLLTEGLVGEKHRAAMSGASEAYTRFLVPFLTPGTKLQLIAFGSDSDFDPARFGQENVDTTSDGFEVSFTIKHSHLNFEDDYVAEIKNLSDGRLVLVQIWYLDPFPETGRERLPCL